MATKRKRGNVTEDKRSKPKRIKFTLEDGHIPSMNQYGAVFVTGSGDCGQLGLGSVQEKMSPALLNLNEEIVDVCAGGMHTVCLTKTGKVLTFGCNDEGALGRMTDNNDEESIPGTVELPGKAKQISAGDSHTAVLLENGVVYAWGTFRDSHGNMGLTSKGNEKLPYKMMFDHTVVKIASGTDHIVFLTNHGEVFTCGCAEQGQLGRTSERSASRNARNGINKNHLAKLLTPDAINIKPRLKLHFDDIWAGNYSTFVKVASKNDIYVFGLNNYNQLGLKTSLTQFTPKISKDFSKYKWKLICCGQHHTMAMNEDGRIFVIGRKDYGRLGLGKDCEDVAELIEIPKFKNVEITNIACGSATSFAVTQNGELYGWGMGTVGQLGTGDDKDRNEPALITIKALSGRKVHKASSGGQHTIILALQANDKTDEQ